MLSRRLKPFMLATMTRHARGIPAQSGSQSGRTPALAAVTLIASATELPPGANGFPVVPQTDSERRRAEEDQGITSIDRARQERRLKRDHESAKQGDAPVTQV